MKTTGIGLELKNGSSVDYAKEEIGGRKVTQNHSIHLFVHSFNKQLLKSYSEKYCEGLVCSISVALMTILIVIRLVQVEAPIEKNVICLLVGSISLAASHSVAQVVQAREGLGLLPVEGPTLAVLGLMGAWVWQPLSLPSSPRLFWCLSSLVEIIECLPPGCNLILGL